MHDHDGRYQRRIPEFFAEGVHDGLRVAYGGRDEADTDLSGVGDLGRLLRSLGELAPASGVGLSVRSPPAFAARLMNLLPRTDVRHGRLGAQP